MRLYSIASLYFWKRCTSIYYSNNICQDNGLNESGQRAGIRSINSVYNTLTGNVCTVNSYGYATEGVGQTIGITADGTSDHHVISSNILYTNLDTHGYYQSGLNNLIGLNQK